MQDKSKMKEVPTEIKTNSPINKPSNISNSEVLWQAVLVGRGLKEIIFAEWSDS